MSAQCIDTNCVSLALVCPFFLCRAHCHHEYSCCQSCSFDVSSQCLLRPCFYRPTDSMQYPRIIFEIFPTNRSSAAPVIRCRETRSRVERHSIGFESPIRPRAFHFVRFCCPQTSDRSSAKLWNLKALSDTPDLADKHANAKSQREPALYFS